jgi:hypothetical protein
MNYDALYPTKQVDAAIEVVENLRDCKPIIDHFSEKAEKRHFLSGKTALPFGLMYFVNRLKCVSLIRLMLLLIWLKKRMDVIGAMML